MSTDTAELLASLEKHNTTFTTLLSLIPAKYYIAPTAEEADNKWMINKKRKTGEEIKEHKQRAKRDKLDPANNLTVPDLLSLDKPTTAIPASTSEAGPSTLTTLPPLNPLPPQSSISDLRAKLQDRLDTFKKDRGVDDSDPQSRDALEAERRKKRGEMRDKRRNDRKAERRKEREEPTAKPAKTQLLVPDLTKQRSHEENISYPLSLPSNNKTHKAPLKSLSNPAQALAHLQKHNTKLASLPEEKRKEIEEAERWAKAEERAGGGKVADEARVLKNAVKRMEKGKAKSGQEWSERKKDIQKNQDIRMKKRGDNIASRLEAKKNKRLGIKDKGKRKDKGGGGGKGKGKGKGRPGFEGGKKGKSGGETGGGAGGGQGASGSGKGGK